MVAMVATVARISFEVQAIALNYSITVAAV